MSELTAIDILINPDDATSPRPCALRGVAVYHPGNNGTARKLLKEWPVAS
jgi:hypothetical protein